MDINNNDRRTFKNSAENCKKALKSLRSKGSNCAAMICTVLIAAAAGAALAVDDVPLDAGLVSSVGTGNAFKTFAPLKKYDVKISVDGKNFGVQCSGTVKDALDAANVTVHEDDLMNIGLGEALNENTEIVINRVDIVEEVQVETIDYATKYREDDTRTIGYTETVVNGEEGEVETTVRNIYVDGELVSSAVIDKDITEPVDEVVVVGTKEYNPIDDISISQLDAPLDLVLDENGVPLDYSKVLTGKSCAYSAKPGALTASGRKAVVGTVAVDPNIIPYGTELYIETTDGSAVYGYAIAADTGTALTDGLILVDLFMGSYEESCEWGAREVNIYILN